VAATLARITGNRNALKAMSFARAMRVRPSELTLSARCLEQLAVLMPNEYLRGDLLNLPGDPARVPNSLIGMARQRG